MLLKFFTWLSLLGFVLVLVSLSGCTSTRQANCGNHSLGERWLADDGCNTCSCSEGGAACTEMACINQTLCPGHNLGDTWLDEWGCNTCSCSFDGIACTKKYCANSSVSCENRPNAAWPAGDGCNICSCAGRRPVCTARACPSINESKSFWASVPKGDLVEDKRDPKAVCSALQAERNIAQCTLEAYNSSFNPTECADGMSVAGCFACSFSCPLTP